MGYLLSFALGIVAFTAINRVVKHDRGKRQETGKGFMERFGVMNLILLIVGVALLAFSLTCIWLFTKYGSIPDTLVTCVFATLGGECGVMGWIKTTKEKNRDRRWEKEDNASG